MTRLVFLSTSDKRKFDALLILNQDQCPAYFFMINDIRRAQGTLRAPNDKFGFIQQLGLFKHSGRFFAPNTFRSRDIKIFKDLLQISQDINQGTLKNTANRCFTLNTIQAANIELLQAINKLSPSNAFRHLPGRRHQQWRA